MGRISDWILRIKELLSESYAWLFELSQGADHQTLQLLYGDVIMFNMGQTRDSVCLCLIRISSF